MSVQLCQLPTCRIRGRHLPTCTDPDCAGCLPRVADEGLICDADMARAERLLSEIVRLAPDARLVAQGLVRRGTGGGSGKPQSRPPLNVDAVGALDAVTNALTTIARDIAETRGLHFVSTAFDGHRVADPLVEAASWLSGQLEWLRHAVGDQGEAVAVDVFREISECAARIRSITDGPREARFLGPCGAEIVDDDPPDDAFAGCPNHGRCLATWDCHAGNCKPVPPPTCEGDVYGIPGAEKGRCKTCGATVDQDQRRAWLDGQVGDSDLAWTASGIADALGLNVKTVRAWSTERRAETGYLLRAAKLGTFWRNADGQLVPWVEPPAHLFEVERRAQIKARGDRLHYVSDVRRLATEAADRRAENEAARQATEIGV